MLSLLARSRTVAEWEFAKGSRGSYYSCHVVIEGGCHVLIAESSLLRLLALLRRHGLLGSPCSSCRRLDLFLGRLERRRRRRTLLFTMVDCCHRLFRCYDGGIIVKIYFRCGRRRSGCWTVLSLLIRLDRTVVWIACIVSLLFMTRMIAVAHDLELDRQGTGRAAR